MPPAGNPRVSTPAAAATAGHDVLVALHPSRTQAVDTLQAAMLAALPPSAGEGKPGRAVRILDDELGRLLADLAAAVDDEAWLAAEYFRTHAPRERRLQLVRLWLEWTAQHRGPRWTLPGVIVTRRGIDFTENADGSGARMSFVAEERAGTYWLVEAGSDAGG